MLKKFSLCRFTDRDCFFNSTDISHYDEAFLYLSEIGELSLPRENACAQPEVSRRFRFEVA